MKQFIALLALFAVISAQDAPAAVGIGWTQDRTKHCSDETVRQIQMEIKASIQYLQLAAYYSRDNVNLPGFAEFFFDAASEEREHAHKLIDYMLMRGFSVEDTDIKYDDHYELIVNDTFTGLNGLEKALQMEIGVTKSIREVIKACEDGVNDYHFVDYLAGEFLDEQHKGQRDIAEKIETLKRMKKTQGHLAEFVFDKHNLLKLDNTLV